MLNKLAKLFVVKKEEHETMCSYYGLLLLKVTTCLFCNLLATGMIYGLISSDPNPVPFGIVGTIIFNPIFIPGMMMIWLMMSAAFIDTDLFLAYLENLFMFMSWPLIFIGRQVKKLQNKYCKKIN